MEGAGACAKGEGTGLYFQSIPFMFYCLATILVVPLIIAGIIPKIGPMRNAYKRAEETGQTIPDTMLERVKFHEEMVKTDGSVKPKAINFVIPMLVLAGVTIGTSDMQWGVLATIVTCLIMYIPQKIMKPGEMFDAILDGMKDMVTPCLIVTGAFLLQAANDKLGMIQYVIDTVAPIMSPAFLPVITFIVVAVLGFCTGCFWGAAAICFPIIIPLAQSIDVNLVLTIGAICSGAGWGSTACFFSDAPTLTCTSTQIANSDYARTVVPMLAVPSAIAVILFTVFGVIMA